MIGSSNDEKDFSHKLLTTDTQVSKICKSFVNSLLGNITFSKSQLSKMIHSGGFLDNILGAVFHPDRSIKKLSIKQINYLKKSVNFAKDVLWASKKALEAEITLTDNEIKRYYELSLLENRGILSKGTTIKITSKEVGF